MLVSRWLLTPLAMAIVAASGCGTRTSLLLPGDGRDRGDGGASASNGGGASDDSGSGPGPDASASTGSGPAFECEPGEPATQLAAIEWPIAMTQDASSLYVASYAELGAVYRVAKDGSAVDKLADLSWPSGVSIADGWLYVASSGDRELVRMPTGGGTVEHVADFYGPSDVVVDGGWAYVANYLDNTLERVPVSGGAVEILAAEQNGIYKLAIVDGWVAWGSFESEVRVVPLGGGQVVSLVRHDARRLAAFGSTLYTTSNGPDVIGIYSTDLDGLDSLLAMATTGFVEGIAVDEAHVYWAWWAYDGRDAVRRAPRGGGPEAEVFRVPEPIEVLVEGICLYATAGQLDPAAGGVFRVGVSP